jgi:subtilisin family serine protease
MQERISGMAHGRYFPFRLTAFLLLFGLTGLAQAQVQRKTQKVLIETSKPYTRVSDAIKARGGKVTWEYEYVNGIAAEIPEEAIEYVRAMVGSSSMDKDVDVPRPAAIESNRSRETHQHSGGVATMLSSPGSAIPSEKLPSFANTYPGAYSVNNAGTRIEKLHGLGLTGKRTIVAIIDSGVRPGYKLTASAYIGGADFVDDGPAGPAGDSESDWRKDTNDGHGTFGAGLIAGNATFALSGVLKTALQLYAPSVIVEGKLPIIGTAPDAKLYIVRVFGDDPTVGAPKSTIIAAIQHVIEQRELYNSTNGRQGIKVDVANLSFGVSTLSAGRNLLDESVDAMLKAGIVPVVSVGNVGPAALTTASPGSSMSAVTTGGLSRAANERILNEVLYGTDFPDEYYVGIGGDLRPFEETEIAYFSSRGPNADGRLDPDVVANSVGNISQGYCPDQILDACLKRLSFGSGTSFSAPIVSGIAAALRQAFPSASATQIRNAIIATARTNQVADHFDVVDRGKGLPDAWAALLMLATNNVPNSLPQVNQPNDSVVRNIEQNTNLEVRSGFFSKSFKNLKPGERGEILYNVPKGTEQVIVKVSNVTMTGPQNPFYGGDAMFFYIHSAKTSSIGAFGDYLIEAEPFFGGEPETQFDLIDPDTGVARIVVNPDTLNAGFVSADVSIEAILEAWPRATISDFISNGVTKQYTVEVKSGTTQMDLLLDWRHDWVHYPTNDVDLVVCDPSITTVADCKAFGIKDGATLAGPERVSIPNPVAGNWMILVSGFNVTTPMDDFTVRVSKIRP